MLSTIYIHIIYYLYIYHIASERAICMHAKLRADAAFISKCQHFSHESQLKFYAAGGGDGVGVEGYGLGEPTLHATRQMFAKPMHIYAIGSVCACVCV